MVLITNILISERKDKYEVDLLYLYFVYLYECLYIVYVKIKVVSCFLFLFIYHLTRVELTEYEACLPDIAI